MLIVCIIIRMLFTTFHTSAQNTSSTESSIGKTTPLIRRQWPVINFEELYENSGDGPVSEANLTESYGWITVVTQIKASIWPTITRIRISTPIPKPKPISVSSTPVFSSDLFSWGSSYGYALSSNSEELLESILQRSSLIYSGPSSSIEFPDGRASSHMISSFSPLSSDLNTIRLSSQSYIPTKSVTQSDRLSEYLSKDKYSPLSSFQIYSDISSIPRIDSSLVISENELTRHSETTPILQSTTLTRSEDKNSIYRTYTSLSFSGSDPKKILSTPTPFISSIETSAHYSRLTATHLQSSSVVIAASKTIDSLSSTKLAPLISSKPASSEILIATSSEIPVAASTPISIPLCPEGVRTEFPNAHALEKPFENYLIRTVLNNTSNEKISDVRLGIEGKIRQIYIYAFGKQYELMNEKGGSARKLLSKHINTTIHVKLWDISIKNSSQQIDVIYYVEKDGTLIPYEDASRTLSYITDDQFSQIIGLQVIDKVKPYNERVVLKSSTNWLGIILIWCSGLLLIICIIAGLLLFCKYRSEKRKWIDAFNRELNRVVPDNQIHWRTVSHHTHPETGLGKDNSEFQYLPFQSDKKYSEASRTTMQSKGIQSNLEMQKEKVIPIAKIIDHSIDTIETRTTFVTTKDINTGEDEDNGIPRIIEVQMSEQTQSIIRAIRNELSKFSNYSISFNDSQPEGSIISNSSEA